MNLPNNISYYAELHQNGPFLAYYTFPQFRGFATEGNIPEEALKTASKILEKIILEIIESKGNLPFPNDVITLNPLDKKQYTLVPISEEVTQKIYEYCGLTEQNKTKPQNFKVNINEELSPNIYYLADMEKTGTFSRSFKFLKFPETKVNGEDYDDGLLNASAYISSYIRKNIAEGNFIPKPDNEYNSQGYHKIYLHKNVALELSDYLNISVSSKPNGEVTTSSVINLDYTNPKPNISNALNYLKEYQTYRASNISSIYQVYGGDLSVIESIRKVLFNEKPINNYSYFFSLNSKSGYCDNEIIPKGITQQDVYNSAPHSNYTIQFEEETGKPILPAGTKKEIEDLKEFLFNQNIIDNKNDIFLILTSNKNFSERIELFLCADSNKIKKDSLLKTSELLYNYENAKRFLFELNKDLSVETGTVNFLKEPRKDYAVLDLMLTPELYYKIFKKTENASDIKSYILDEEVTKGEFPPKGFDRDWFNELFKGDYKIFKPNAKDKFVDSRDMEYGEHQDGLNRAREIAGFKDGKIHKLKIALKGDQFYNFMKDIKTALINNSQDIKI